MLVQISADLAAWERDLRAGFTGEIRLDKISRALYSTDASVYQIEPIGVLIPDSRDGLIHAVRACLRHRVPMTLRGGGTSQAGQAIGEGIQIDCSKYINRVLEVDPAGRWARVEPGIVLDELNAQLAPHGLRFAPDVSTASRATIGGMISNNSSGARSVIYGKTIDHVLELTVLLADGSIATFKPVERGAVPTGDTLEARCYAKTLALSRDLSDEIGRRYPKILRRVAGYNLDEFTDAAKPVNLAKLIVGSEGTLAVLLDAKINLVPLPKVKAVMVIEFSSLLESLAAAPAILQHKPSAIEVMDKAILDHTRQNRNLQAIRETFLQGDPASMLCVEFYGDRTEDLPPRLDALEADLRARGFGYAYRKETNPAQQARVWNLRESALGLSMAMKEDAKSISFVEDCAVAPEKLRDFIERFLAILDRHGTTAGVYAHASVGCLHVRPVVNLKTEAGVRMFESIANEVSDLTLEFGGAFSGEHGDGLVRSPFLEKMFGPEIYAAFREIKRTFDPENLFNPGKIVDPPPMTGNLRYGAGYKTARAATWFDYSDYGGIGGAVEMCSGVGACRKKLSGTMCPSYMATLDEAHTTRGRANVLRLAMAGRLGESGLGDDGVYSVLDLCLECRACKAECPVNVDVARFKSEFLADYYTRHGTPLRSRALGGIHKLAPLASAFAPVSNWLASATAAAIGIDSRRSVPEFQRRTLMSRVRSAADPTVTLFADTFANYHEPENGVAAIRVLEAAGHRVQVARPGCCARPAISMGLLEDARSTLCRTINAMHRLVESGRMILVLEPSCLSSFREDAPALLRGDAQAKAREVAGAVMLWDEFAAGLNLPFRSGPRRVLLHGHCHQKSMGLLGATQSLLGKIPGAQIVDLDAGCCGMAGSFGYTRDHYGVSVAIAERKLLPAARSLKSDEALVAVGTSCRHQLHDLARYAAPHPAVLLSGLL
jgi:FAD/FMN-containing dehydrogenase/Fe-S oxidoreductase